MPPSQLLSTSLITNPLCHRKVWCDPYQFDQDKPESYLKYQSSLRSYWSPALGFGNVLASEKNASCDPGLFIPEVARNSGVELRGVVIVSNHARSVPTNLLRTV